MRKSLCIVLILLMCFVTTYTYAENEASTNAKDLQTQRDELHNQLDEANGQLGDVQSNLSDNLKQIEKLDEKITTSQEKLDEQESKITELKESIEQVETDLDGISERYEKQKELFKKRLVAIYEAGDTQYLDILLKSRSLSDFLSSYYIITELAEIDDTIITEISEKQKRIDLYRQKLENEKNELALIIENQTRVARTLENTKKLRESFIAQLSDEERALQAKIDEVNKQYEEVNRQLAELAKYSMEQGILPEYLGGELAWPTPGYTRITSEYKMRVHPITGQYKLHTGVDIGAPYGADFVAANDGIVIKAGMNSAYGNMVVIDHGGGISTLYAHGSQIVVELGQSVKRGDTVLKVGSTGYSTGAHAHFEVRINGVPTNPMPYITNGLIPGQENEQQNNNNSNN